MSGDPTGGRDEGETARSDRDVPPAERIAVDDLRIEADLDLAVDGDPVRVRSTGGRIDVFVRRFGVLPRIDELRRALPSPVGDALERVPVGVHVAGVEVARVDPGVPSGPLSRLLGVAPARVDLPGVARALLRRRE
ncbi:hypothetical protein [Halobaculum sp. EA56]|uniref:hypothetical protein n=1 Tax=Halobaculum sp. EA56 TaxID=3421648 RepID=UPI003EB9AAF0